MKTWLRRLCLGLVTFLLALVTAIQPRTAWAVDDVIDTWEVVVHIDRSGTAHIEEIVVYRFGLSSGRHGMTRSLRVREPFNDKQDAKYSVKNVNVFSPNASDDFTMTTQGKHRVQDLVLVIGSPATTVSRKTAEYEISYDLIGAVYASDETHRFSWTITGSQNLQVNKLNITVESEYAVSSRLTGSKSVECAEKGSGFECSAGSLSSTDDIRLEVDLDPAVSARAQQLLRRGDWGSRLTTYVLSALTALSLIGSIVGVVLILRRKRRDLRFEGVDPGVIPEGKATITLDSKPVHINPIDQAPEVSIAEAAVLTFGQVRERDLAATVLDLARRGAIQLVVGQRKQLSGKLLDASVATVDHEKVLLDRLFGGKTDWVDLGGAGSRAATFDDLSVSVRNQVAESKWFTDIRLVGKASLIAAVAGIVLVAYLFLSGAGVAELLITLMPLVPVLLMFLVVNSVQFRGRRTAVGRAITDQTIGYGAYLSAAKQTAGLPTAENLVWMISLLPSSEPDIQLESVRVPGSWLLIADKQTSVNDLNYVAQVLESSFTSDEESATRV